MRYARIYQAAAQQPPVENTNEVSDRDAGLVRGWSQWQRIGREFEPTGNPLVDALVEAHSPVIKYDTPPDDFPGTAVTVAIEPGHENDPMPPDVVHMPPPEAYVSPEAFQRTLLHELSHWTNLRVKRLERVKMLEVELPAPTQSEIFRAAFGGDPVSPRALEELVAELSATIVSRAVGVGEEWRSMRYLRAWLGHLETAGYNDAQRQAIFSVAGALAKDSAAYLLQPLNLSPMEDTQ